MSHDAFEGANVRAAVYWIARTAVACDTCGQRTEVAALALPAEHETLDPEAEITMGVWRRADCNALIFHVEWLAAEIQCRLLEYSSTFAKHPSSNWVNHCRHCGAALDDLALHCEPEGAFVPTSHAAARAIELIRIEAPFEAKAAGYSYEPEFLAFAARF